MLRFVNAQWASLILVVCAGADATTVRFGELGGIDALLSSHGVTAFNCFPHSLYPQRGVRSLALSDSFPICILQIKVYYK